MLGLAPAVEKENVWRSGSFGDSKALGIAGTGGTSSPSTPAELWTLRGFAVGNLELCKVGLVRRGMEEPLGGFKELMLDVEDKEMPEAYDLRFRHLFVFHIQHQFFKSWRFFNTTAY